MAFRVIGEDEVLCWFDAVVLAEPTIVAAVFARQNVPDLDVSSVVVQVSAARRGGRRRKNGVVDVCDAELGLRPQRAAVREKLRVYGSNVVRDDVTGVHDTRAVALLADG